MDAPFPSREAIIAARRVWGRPRRVLMEERKRFLLGIETYSLKENYQRLLAQFKQRTVEGRDNITIIDGETRQGKSTLALNIAIDRYPKFNVKEHMGYTLLEILYAFLRICDSGEKGVSYLADEVIIVALSNDYGSEGSKMLVRMFNVCAVLQIDLLLVIPKLKRLNFAMRAEIAKWWIHVDARGHAIYHERKDNDIYDPDLQFYKDPEGSDITWRRLEGTRVWEEYSERKLGNIRDYILQMINDVELKEAQKEAHDPREKDRSKALRTLDIVELVQKGKTVREIREQLGGSQDSIAGVSRALREAGDPLTLAAEAQRRAERKTRAQADREVARAKRAGGVTTTAPPSA